MEINKSTTMAKLQNIWSSEIGEFVMSQASGRLTESYPADQFKKDFETFVDANLNKILGRITIPEQLSFGQNEEGFKTLFISLYQSDEVQVIYLLNELAFTKSKAAELLLNQSSSSESEPRGMYDASSVDKTVLMFLH